MTTPLEDRLRAHFAEQAAREDVGEPDPAAVMARALDAPRPLPSDRRRGRGMRITVAAGLAAACVLAVVAVVAATDRHRDSVDMRGEPTTTEPAPTETPTTPTTTPSTSTPTSTPQTPATTTSVAVARLGVLGWWDGERWVDSAPGDAPPVEGGEQYQVASLGLPDVATVTGPAPERSEGGICGGYGISLPSLVEPPAQQVGVTGVADIQPRPVTRIDAAGYRGDVVAALADLGIRDPEPPLTQAVRTDLDGDGSDEVLITASRLPGAGDESQDGDYSVVFLRRVVAGSVQTVSIDREVHEFGADGPQYLLELTVTAVADLNGDARMEVVIDHSDLEIQDTYAYEVDATDGMVRVLGVGCGS